MLRDKVSRNLGVSRDPTDPRNPGLGVSRDPSDPRNLITLKNNGLSLPSDGSLNKKWLNSELNSIEKVGNPALPKTKFSLKRSIARVGIFLNNKIPVVLLSQTVNISGSRSRVS